MRWRILWQELVPLTRTSAAHHSLSAGLPWWQPHGDSAAAWRVGRCARRGGCCSASARSHHACACACTGHHSMHVPHMNGTLVVPPPLQQHHAGWGACRWPAIKQSTHASQMRAKLVQGTWSYSLTASAAASMPAGTHHASNAFCCLHYQHDTPQQHWANKVVMAPCSSHGFWAMLFPVSSLNCPLSCSAHSASYKPPTAQQRAAASTAARCKRRKPLPPLSACAPCAVRPLISGEQAAHASQLGRSPSRPRALYLSTCIYS